MLVGETTFSTTGTVIGLPVAPEELITTCPVYCPADSVPALTETETFPGAVPLAGVAESQVPPLVVDAVVVKGNDAGELVTATVCAAGTGPPASWMKLRVAVGAEIEPGVTTTWTPMVAGLFPAPGDVTVTEPV
jgi:hypothetical protein